MTRTCPKCQAVNRLEAVHCASCGHKLPEMAFRPGPPVRQRWSIGRPLLLVVILLLLGAAVFALHGRIDWSLVRDATQQGTTGIQSLGPRSADAVRRWHGKWFSPDPLPPDPAPQTSAPPDEAETALPAPSTRALKIRCPNCDGFGFVGDDVARSTCKLCLGSGGRDLVMPLQAELCNACHGMGYVLRRGNAPEPIRMLCKFCAGHGYVERKY